ncbi:MAG: hypothetical protein ABJB66_20480, partial [Gemmatimonadaceae bacterium]
MKDQGDYGWKAWYSLVNYDAIENPPGARLTHVNRISINVTLTPLGNGNYTGGFTQNDDASDCHWISLHPWIDSSGLCLFLTA